jgi:hypothetical protein
MVEGGADHSISSIHTSPSRFSRIQ